MYKCPKCDRYFESLKDYRKCCTAEDPHRKIKYPQKEYKFTDEFKNITINKVIYYVCDDIYVFKRISNSCKIGDFVGNYDNKTKTITFIDENIANQEEIIENIDDNQPYNEEKRLKKYSPYNDEESQMKVKQYIKERMPTIIFNKLTTKYKQLYLNILVTSNQNPDLFKNYFDDSTNYEHLFETLKLAIQLQKKEIVFMLCDIISKINLSINWSLLQYEAKLTGNMKILSRLMFEDFVSQI